MIGAMSWYFLVPIVLGVIALVSAIAWYGFTAGLVGRNWDPHDPR